jgi:hypothetical protein
MAARLSFYIQAEKEGEPTVGRTFSVSFTSKEEVLDIISFVLDTELFQLYLPVAARNIVLLPEPEPEAPIEEIETKNETEEESEEVLEIVDDIIEPVLNETPFVLF